MKQEKFKYDTFFHVYNRGNNKEDIFIEDKNYSYFLKLIKDHLLGVAEIYAYCLLKNHFHLIIRIKDKNEIRFSSEMIADLFSHTLNITYWIQKSFMELSENYKMYED